MPEVERGLQKRILPIGRQGPKREDERNAMGGTFSALQTAFATRSKVERLHRDWSSWPGKQAFRDGLLLHIHLAHGLARGACCAVGRVPGRSRRGRRSSGKRSDDHRELALAPRNGKQLACSTPRCRPPNIFAPGPAEAGARRGKIREI